MAVILPFRGLRYAPGVGPLRDLVTPPYDVIDAAAQDAFYRRHPCNIIRLEYGKTYREDTESNNRYTRAAADFAAWQEKGVLVPEAAPALYRYEQEFTLAGRTRVRSGMICAVRLEPYENGVVLPHEETLPKHKADRLALMQACAANFSPIFGLYADPEMIVDDLLRRPAGAPDADFTDENGVTHRLWVIGEQNIINAVRENMAGRRIFIADGHHRYETALNYRRLRREAAGDPPGEQPYDYVMMTLVNLYDPGLVVLPTHRLVRNVPDLDSDRLLARIGELFTVEPFPLDADRGNFPDFLAALAEKAGAGENCSARESAPAGETVGSGGPAGTGVSARTEDRPPAPHRHVFGLYCGSGRLYTLTLKDEDALPALMPPEHSPAWRGLDVAVLHQLIMEKMLGIGGRERAGESHLTYTREETGALDAVDRGEYQLAFFLNPTRVAEVTAVAAGGEKMPQKSTFFYPKLITGLVINKLS